MLEFLTSYRDRIRTENIISPFMITTAYSNLNYLLSTLAITAVLLLAFPISERLHQRPTFPKLAHFSALLFVCATLIALVHIFYPPQAPGFLAILAVSATALASLFCLFRIAHNACILVGIIALWVVIVFGAIKLSPNDISYFGYEYFVFFIIIGTAFAISLILGRLIFGRCLTRGKYVDYLSLSAIIAPLAFLCYLVLLDFPGDIIIRSKYNAWVVHGALLLAIIYALSFYGRSIPNAHRPFDKTALSTAVILGAIAMWWSPPYFRLPPYIETEYFFLVTLVAVFALSRIWRGRALAQHWMFAASILAIIAQFSDITFANNQLFDTLVLGVIMVLVLFVSFFLKKPRWFLLAVLTLGVFIFYFT